jgi:signal transduction histidine kinase
MTRSARTADPAHNRWNEVVVVSAVNEGRERDRDKRRRRRRRRTGGSGGGPPRPPGPAKRKLSPEEKAYREARAAANQRIGFMSHAIAYGSVCFFLLFVAGFRPAMIVALAWGIGLAVHGFGALVAPKMRRRIIEREVGQRLGPDVHRERRTMETAQAHRVEELAAGVAHEIRNPITAAKSLVQQMGEDPQAGENVEYANVALAELERVEKSISHLLRFAREEEMEVTDVRLTDVVEGALDTFRDRLATIDVDRDIHGHAVMRGDPEKLRRVLINLVGNALDAFEEAGTPHPELHVTAGENLAGTEVWVRLKDNGPGMEPERLSKIFSPFYTSKTGGTGIGLAISKKVVDAHGGSIEAHSAPGAGTEFVLTFPKMETAAEDPS